MLKIPLAIVDAYRSYEAGYVGEKMWKVYLTSVTSGWSLQFWKGGNVYRLL